MVDERALLKEARRKRELAQAKEGQEQPGKEQEISAEGRQHGLKKAETRAQQSSASAPPVTATPSSRSSASLPSAKRKDTDQDTTQPKRAKHESFDAEWAEFQRTVLAPSRAPAPTYEHATISAEPELHTQAPDQAEPSEAERRALIDQAAREEILARIEDEQRAQDEAEERYVHIHSHTSVQSLRARFAKIKQARQRRDATARAA